MLEKFSCIVQLILFVHFGRDVADIVLSLLLIGRFISVVRTCANRPEPPRTNKFDIHHMDVFV
jgi:hypothetical protein